MIISGKMYSATRAVQSMVELANKTMESFPVRSVKTALNPMSKDFPLLTTIEIQYGRVTFTRRSLAETISDELIDEEWC